MNDAKELMELAVRNGDAFCVGGEVRVRERDLKMILMNHIKASALCSQAM